MKICCYIPTDEIYAYAESRTMFCGKEAFTYCITSWLGPTTKICMIIFSRFLKHLIGCCQKPIKSKADEPRRLVDTFPHCLTRKVLKTIENRCLLRCRVTTYPWDRPKRFVFAPAAFLLPVQLKREFR